MTNADKIRSLSNDELVKLLVWGIAPPDTDIPECNDGCEHYMYGCHQYCPDDRRERNIREWLDKETD